MSISVLVSCEVDLADLPLEDHAVDVIAAVDIDLEYEVPVSYYPGEDAVTDRLPEDCHPGSSDEWELDGFSKEEIAKVACDIASRAAPGLSTYELWSFVNYIIADIETFIESETFSEMALDKGNDKATEEPDEPDYDPRDNDLNAEDEFDYLK